jgi:hypothetical protein
MPEAARETWPSFFFGVGVSEERRRGGEEEKRRSRDEKRNRGVG